MSFLLQWLEAFATWLWNAMITGVNVVVGDMLSAVVTVLQAIPEPSWMSGASAAVGNIPPLMAYFCASLNIGQGISIIGSALLLRFLLRRIP